MTDGARYTGSNSNVQREHSEAALLELSATAGHCMGGRAHADHSVISCKEFAAVLFSANGKKVIVTKLP
jgi:hypothetical protein